jgi:hypothetical protein
MRWTLKLELTADDGATHAHELGSISRSMHHVQPDEVGLTLEEGRVLVQAIECRMIADQIHACTLCCRKCPDCGGVTHRPAGSPTAFSSWVVDFEPYTRLSPRWSSWK